MTANKFRLCLPPFQKCKSSGPYIDKKEGRLLIHLLEPKVKAQTMTYARYLYCVKTGAVPTEGFEVDHIDGNKFNDSIGNLQLLSSSQNASKTKYDPVRRSRTKMVLITCPVCEKQFLRKYHNSFLSSNRCRRSFCSLDCKKLGAHESGREQRYQILDAVKPVFDRFWEPWEDWSSVLTLELSRVPIKEQKRTCLWCETVFTPTTRKQKYCKQECSLLAFSNKSRKVDPSVAEATVLQVVEGVISWEKAGKIHGVSGNAVRKWARNLGYQLNPRKYNKKR